MLAYYPDLDFYVAGSFEHGFVTVDINSTAFGYCAYCHSKFAGVPDKDPEGEYILVVQVSEYRVEQIQSYVRTENNFRYLMANDL